MPLVTRPPCSWTSTCCSVVQPGPPTEVGHVGGVEPELDRPLVVGLRHLVGEPPVVLLGLDCSKRISSSVNSRARRWRSRSAGVRPYMGPPPRRSLTDCSVYARLAGVTSGSPRTADAVVVGGGTVGAWCAWFLREAGLADVVLVERRTLGAGREPARGRAWSGPRAAPRRRSGSASSAGTSTPASTSGSASTPASSPRATSCRASPTARWPRPRPGSRCSRASGSTCAGSGPTSSTSMNPAMARGQTLGGSYAPGDGYIDPPRNVLAYTAALFTSGVHVRRAHRVHRPAPRRATGSPGSPRRPARSPPSGSCSPAGPTLAAVGRAAGVRIPAGGARHQVVVTEAAPRPRAPTGCRWSSTSRPASTGGPRRAACSGG